jgi:hypothetical protein
MKKMIELISRHIIVQGLSQEVPPSPILMAHVLLFRRILLLGFEKTF